jgi:hypothetical protein
MTKYLFVEGYYDEIFVKKISEKLQVESEIKIVQYSRMRDPKVVDYLSSLISQKIHFLLIADRDIAQYNSINDRENELIRRYKHVNSGNYVLAIPEIEGWYVAGLNDKSIKKLKLKNFPLPDDCTKEKFIAALPFQQDGTPIRNEMLELYDIHYAEARSSSFRKFVSIIENW